MSIPAIALAALLFGLFLLATAVVAFVAMRQFMTRGPNGEVQPLGCLAGCAVALTLGLLGLFGFGAFLAAVMALTGRELVEHRPPRRVSVFTRDETRSEADGFYDPSRPLHVVLEIGGHDEPFEELLSRIGPVARGEARVRRTFRHDPGGEPYTIVDIAFPGDRDDLRRAELEVRRLMPELRADGLRIELRSVHRDS